MNTTQAPTLTTAQAARRLNRGAEWVSQLVAAGRIKGHKVGNRWRIDADSLEAYILERKRPGKQPKAMPLEPRPPGAYQYQGVVDLVMAVVTLAADEAVGGDLPAQLWIASRASDHWFHYVNIDPDAAREAIFNRLRSNGEENGVHN
jgi:excisionase family DNA binding protein